ncbi:hypothetical protein DCBHLPFO_00678 [Mycoplasmopsis arginini]|uniref:Uncharacterized protein n=1 Tax=Mycoplasmopsis arginini TaxID=2094 RepID=A0AA43QZ98_MYCAR|nr:hypothetical protein [Mycoplasmopsis arginini]
MSLYPPTCVPSNLSNSNLPNLSLSDAKFCVEANLPTVSYVDCPILFRIEVKNHSLFLGAERDWSVSTPTIYLSFDLSLLIKTFVAGPATGRTIFGFNANTLSIVEFILGVISNPEDKSTVSVRVWTFLFASVCWLFHHKIPL